MRRWRSTIGAHHREAAVSGSAAGNDTDVDGTPLTACSTRPGQRHLALNLDGSFTYTPDANFNGTDTLQLQGERRRAAPNGDGDHQRSARSTMRRWRSTTAAPRPRTRRVSGTCRQRHGRRGTPLDGSAGRRPGERAPDARPERQLHLYADANFNGTDTFTYTVSDGNGGTDIGDGDHHGRAVNDAPVAVDDAAPTTEDTAVSGNVLGQRHRRRRHAADGRRSTRRRLQRHRGREPGRHASPIRRT